MNSTVLTGRLTKDPEVRYSNEKAVARFTLAVNRRGKDAGADFISCVAFGKTAEMIEKYFRKGMKMDLSGRIQTGNYEKDGRKVYTTDVVAENVEFGESKNASAPSTETKPSDADGFMAINMDIDEEEIPFI